MTRLESLVSIKQAVLFHIDNLASANAAESQAAQKQLHALADRFYQENEDFMAGRQCQAAKYNMDYFIVLLDLAIAHAKDERRNKGKQQ